MSSAAILRSRSPLRGARTNHPGNPGVSRCSTPGYGLPTRWVEDFPGNLKGCKMAAARLMSEMEDRGPVPVHDPSSQPERLPESSREPPQRADPRSDFQNTAHPGRVPETLASPQFPFPPAAFPPAIMGTWLEKGQSGRPPPINTGNSSYCGAKSLVQPPAASAAAPSSRWPPLSAPAYVIRRDRPHYTL